MQGPGYSEVPYDFRSRSSIADLITKIDELKRDLPVTDENSLTAEGEVLYSQLEKDLYDAITNTKEVDGGLETVSIAVSLPDGEVAVKVADALLKAFFKHAGSTLRDTLNQNKKLFSSEVMRYRRMLSENETKAMRTFALWDLPAGVDLGDDYSILKVVGAMKHRHFEIVRAHGEYLAMIAELEEMTEGKPLSDAVAIQLAQWKGKLAIVTKELEKMPAEQKEMKSLSRRHFHMRGEMLNWAHERKLVTEKLQFWSEQLRIVEAQKMFALSEDIGIQLKQVQLAELQDRSLID